MRQDKTKYGITCLIHNSPCVGGDGLGSYCPVCYDKDVKFKEFVDDFRQLQRSKLNTLLNN